MSRHHELSIDVSEIEPVHLELEAARSHELVGPYGAFVATMAPAELTAQAWRAPSYAPSAWRTPAPRSAIGGAVERVFDAFAALPMAIWKRLALYGFLFLLVGNLLRCGGLSTMTNVACALLVMFGLVGVVACAQRNP